MISELSLQSHHYSEIEDDLKIILLENIQTIINAITNYQICGLKGIESAYERVAGSLIIRKNSVEKASENAESENEIASFWKALEKVHKLIDAANGARDLIAPLSTLLN